MENHMEITTLMVVDGPAGIEVELDDRGFAVVRFELATRLRGRKPRGLLTRSHGASASAGCVVYW